MLDFSCHHISAVPFLERYLRIFGIDIAVRDKNAMQITGLARQYLRFMQRESQFLNFRPSQLASASLLFAINISISNVAPTIKVRKIHELQLKSLFFETAILLEIAGVKIEEGNVKCPLRMWNESVQKLTLVKKEEDIKPCYRALVESLNEVWYDGKLYGDPSLFLEDATDSENEPSYDIKFSEYTEK